jgi:hypothetical protein
MSLPILHQLQQASQLTLINPSNLAREQRERDRLQRLPSRTYLQDYDLLFRYVSCWLGEQGYSFTNKQPHQALIRICEYLAPHLSVREVSRCRHALKYQQEVPTTEATAALVALLLVMTSY